MTNVPIPPTATLRPRWGDPRVALVLLGTLGACSRRADERAATVTSATVAPSIPATSASASASADSGRPRLQALASAAAPTVSQVYPAKIVIGACTFELSAPEPLHPETKDAMSVTYSGRHVRFSGSTGQDLGLGPLVVFEKPETTLFVDEDRDPALLVRRNPRASKPLDAVSGYGAERYTSGRASPTGCGFLCSGESAFEGDVVAMCKSVRVVTGAKKP